MPDDTLRVRVEADVSGLSAMVQKFQEAGLKGEELVSALKNLGISSTEANSAIKSLASSTAQTAGALQEFSVNATQSSTATEALAQSVVTTMTGEKGLIATLGALETTLSKVNASMRAKTEATVQASAATGGLERAEAMAATRIIAMDAGVGGLGLALGRVAAVSTVLGPIMAAAFPVLAIVAAVQIVSSLFDEMTKLADAEQKAADEDAAFERQMEKTVETLDKAREKAAALGGGAIAQAAEELKNFGDKEVDVSADVKKLNERLEEQPGFFKRLGIDISEFAIEAFHGFDDYSEDAERSLTKFNRQVMDGVKTQRDIGAAIGQVTEKMKELQSVADHPPLAAFSEDAQKNLARMLAFEGEFLSALTNMQQSGSLEQLNIQQALDEKLIGEKQRAQRAIVDLDEAGRRGQLAQSEITREQERDALVADEEKKYHIVLEGINERRALLSQRQAAEPETDFSKAFDALKQEGIAANADYRRQLVEIYASSNEAIRRNEEETQIAIVQAERRTLESADRVADQKARLSLSKAGSPAEIEKATVEYLKTENQLYQDQIEEKTKLLAISKADPTEQARRQEIALNSEIIALKNEQAAKEIEIEAEKNNKIRELRRREVEEELSDLQGQLRIVEDAGRQRNEAIILKHEEEDTNLRKFTAARISEAQREYQEEAAILSKEIQTVQAAVNARILTETEGKKRLSEIWHEEERAYQDMLKAEEKAQADAERRQQQSIDRIAKQFGTDFAKMTNDVLLGKEKIGTALAQMAAQMELQLIDRGIAKVVSKFAGYLLDLLAKHESWIASMLGIEIAGNTSKQAIEHAAAITSIGADAAAAAAGGFASVMVALPFPLNVATAPGVAATAGAETLAQASFMAFEKGGIIPQTGLIQAHADEMVLPKHISNFIQGAASNYSSSSASNTSFGGDSHFHTTINNNGPDSHMRTEAEFAKMISRAQRRGHLPSGPF